MVRAVSIALVVCLGLAGMARADLDPNRKVSFDQKLSAQVPLDLSFRDETGRTVKLGEYFQDGRPVVLVMAYYRCPQLCTLVLNDLVKAMLEIEAKVGKDYKVLTISFDARETPKLAAAKKRMYVANYGRPGVAEAWHFLTGDKDAIGKLTDAIGFRFRYDERFDQFAHATGIVVLTPKGRVSRYLYGLIGNWQPRDLQFSLMDASGGKIGSPVYQFLMLCYHYDPTQGKYDAAVMTIVRIGGVLTVIGIALMVAIFLWREKRHARFALDAGISEPGASATGHA